MTTPRREDFRFINPLRVRWSEVDQQKVVFNAHYLTYFDIGITDYWRAMAIPYEASMPGLGGEPFVRKATVEFHASARLDDQLEVGLKCARIGTSSMGFVGGIFRDEQLLISSELVYVFADPIAQVSVPVPHRLREIMLGYEACEPMTRTEIGAWPELAAELLELAVATVEDFVTGTSPAIADSTSTSMSALRVPAALFLITVFCKSTGLGRKFGTDLVTTALIQEAKPSESIGCTSPLRKASGSGPCGSKPLMARGLIN